MTIRTIIMLLTIPLFLLMAVVNATVLYFQEQSDLTRALADQTLAAAVVTAEFAQELDDPSETLRQPQRRAAINAAGNHIEGLQGLYLIEHPGTVIALSDDSMDWVPPVEWVSTSPDGQTAQQASIQNDDADVPYFAAIIPAGDGRAIAARVDGSALLANRSEIAWIAALIILSVGIFSAALSWFVARKVSKELRWNGDFLAAMRKSQPFREKSELTMRETHDLSDAVSLMKSSHDAASDRHRREAHLANVERTSQSAAKDIHAALFADASKETDGHKGSKAAVRIFGDVPVGTFHAIFDVGDVIHVVIGQCAGDNGAEALANASATRRFFEDNVTTLGMEECRSLAGQGFALERLQSLSSHGSGDGKGALQLACLASGDVCAEARTILKNSEGLSPEQLLNTIGTLLKPNGIFAAIVQR